MNISDTLFKPGTGWLRWSMQERIGYDWIPDAYAYAPYPYTVAPPLRLLANYLWQWVVAPYIMLRGIPNWYPDGRTYHYTWEEVGPVWPDWYKEQK